MGVEIQDETDNKSGAGGKTIVSIISYIIFAYFFILVLFFGVVLIFEYCTIFKSDIEWHNKRDADLVRLQLLKREINEEKLSVEEVRAVAAHMITNCTQIQTLLGMSKSSVVPSNINFFKSSKCYFPIVHFNSNCVLFFSTFYLYLYFILFYFILFYSYV